MFEFLFLFLGYVIGFFRKWIRFEGDGVRDLIFKEVSVI